MAFPAPITIRVQSEPNVQWKVCLCNMAKEPVLYEAMYIFDVELSEEKIAEIEETLKASLIANGAEFVAVQPFGRRRFTFEIMGRREGIYRIMYFKGDGKAVEEIRHEFILSEDILRGMVTVANPRMIIGAKPEKPAAVAEPVVEEEVVEEIAAEIVEEAPVEEAPAEEVVAEEVVAEEVVEEAAAEETAEEAPATEDK